MTNATRSARNQADQAKPNQSGFRRKRLLGSGSALAAAIAMAAALADPVSAQSAPPMHSQVRIDQNIHPMMRDMPQTRQEVNAPRVRQPMATGRVPANAQNQARSLPTPIATERMMIDRGVTLEVPEIRQAASSNTGPSTGPTNIIQPVVNTISMGPVTTASSTPATTPGDTDVLGINVLATANYFSSDVDFNPGAAEDVVDILGPQAIINWTTSTAGSAGTTVDFLPAGANLRFTSALSEFTVLNRVFTPGIDSAIRIDGTVTSDVLGGSVTGGNVWFYSPGGIVVGPTATFDVGSLVLTSSEITAITATGINFGGVAEPDTSVIIESGAIINAIDDVILLAPRVEQGGTVSAGGNIAYVGAQEALITSIDGLFDISILVGTDDASGVVHTGSTGGATPFDDPNRAIEMAAQGRGSAVTMLLGGNIGYDDASVATASNGTIFLSAGDGSLPNSGNISIGAADFNSSVQAQATGTITLAVDGQTSAINFGSATQSSQVSLSAEQAINFSATSGANIAVNGNLTATATDGANGGAINVTIDDAGRNDAVSTSGLLVQGNAEFNASALGQSDGGSSGIGEDAIGGTITVDVSLGGELDAGGDLRFTTDAQGGFGGTRAGSSAAGSVNLTITGANTSVTAGGSLSLSSQATEAVDPFSSPGSDFPPEFGSGSSGGTIAINLTDGTLSAPTLFIDTGAIATDGFGIDGANTQDAVAGDVTLTSSGNLDLGEIFVQANALGAAGGAGGFFEDGAAGGSGTGGNVTITSATDLVNLTGLSIAARGDGGAGGDGGFSATGGAGGLGQGGNVSVSVSGTGPLLDITDTLFIDTSGQGGAGAIGGGEASLTDSGDGGAGGDGIGGTSSFTIGGTGATFTFNSDLFQLQADGNGGAGGAGALNFSGLNAGNGGVGGDGIGGTVSLEALSGSTLTLTSDSVGFNFSSSGNGGAGGSGGGIDMVGGGFAGNGGDGGTGTGGSPQLIATGGTITGGNVDLIAIGAGGSGGIGGDDGLMQIGADGVGGDAAGGSPTITTIDGSPGIISFGNLNINASSFAGGGSVTGTASGGQITITDGSADPAGLITLGSLSVTSTGTAGTSAGLLTISSDSGPITVTGAVNANVTGDIDLVFDGDGQLDVGAATTLTASDNITITHTNNTGDVNTLDSNSGIQADAGLAFAAGAGTNLVSNFFVTIDAGSIAYDDITATNAANLTSITGSITGTSTGTITASNVIDAINLLSAQDITFGNLVSLNGNIDIDASGDIIGVDANSEQFINIDSTGAPAGLIDIDTVTSGSLATITGGSIDIESFNPGFIANVTSSVGDIDIAAISSGSTLTLNSAGALIAGEVTSGGLSFSATAVTDVTIGSLVTTGNVADVGISAGGTATYTSIDGDRLVAINAGAIVGGDINVDATVRLNAGTIDIGAIVVDELGNVDLDATTGDLSVGAITGNLVSANAFGNLTTGLINATSTGLGAGGNATIGDINTGGLSINVTGNVDAANITGTSTVATTIIGIGGDADFDSLTVNNVLNLDAAGALTGGAFTNLGPGALILIDAGSVNVDSVTSATQSLNVTALTGDAIIGFVDAGFAANVNAALGNVQVGSATSGTGTTFNGRIVTLDSGDVGGTLRLNATAGNVTGTGAVTVGGGIDLDATGDIVFGSLDAGTTFTANAGGNISFDSASAASTLTFFAVGDIGFTSLSGDNTVTLIAESGAINGGDVTTDQVAASSSFTSGTSVTLGDVTTRILTVNAGTDITLGAVDALGRDIRGTAIDLTAGGNIDFASLTAGRGVSIDTATISGGDILADDGVDIQAEAINVGDVEVLVTGNIRLATTLGDLTVGNVANTTFGITLDSAAALTAGNLAVSDTANSSDINLTAGTDAIIGDAVAGNQLGLDVTGNLTAGNLVSNVVSPGTVINVGGDADIASFDALLGTGSFTIGGALTGGTLAAESVLTLNAASIDIAGATSRTQSIIATAATGDAAIGDAQAAIDLTVTANNGTPIVGAFTVGDDISLTGLSVTLGAGDIIGNLLLSALTGDVTLALDGNESITVGGQATLDANGSIIVTHTNNAAGAISLDAAGNILATARGSIDAQAGSILSGFETFLLASGSINVDDVRGIPGVVIQGGGSVTVNNAATTGPQGTSNIRGITIDAGLDPFGGSVTSYDNLANALITGSVNSYADVTIRAGGNAEFAGGSTVTADDRVFVQTGDDIIVASGATIISANNPSVAPPLADPFSGIASIILRAGGLTNLLSAPATPIASLVVNGTLNANEGAIIASANAVDGLGGTFNASSIAVDIEDAPSNAVIAAVGQSDDNGLLSAACVQGNICIGNMSADNIIEIGQASNNDAIALIIEQGTVNASDIRITTRNDIVMGTNGIATTLNATNSFSATSISGDVNLFDAAITSDRIQISAAGSLLGSASLTSTGDIGITVGQDLNAAAIVTDGRLVEAGPIGLPATALTFVPGSASIDLLSVGVGNIDIGAGGSIRIGTAIVPGTDIFLSGSLFAQLDFTNTAANVVLGGGSAVFGDITATGNVNADVGGSVDLTSIDAGNDIDLIAGAGVTGGDLTAGGSAVVDAQTITLGTVDATNIALSSASDILFNSLISPNAITLTATGGTIGLNTGPGDIDSGGSVTLTAQAINVGDINAAAVNAAASAGGLSVGDVTTSALGSPISLNAAGAAGDINAGTLTTNSGDILISAGRDIALVGAANSAATPTAGSIALLAGGNISATGTLTAGEDLAVLSLGDTSLAAVSAGDDVSIEAGGSITLDSATSTGAGIDLFALVLNAANAGQAGSVLFAGETSAGSNISLVGGTDVTVTGTLNSARNVDVNAVGTPSIGNTISGGDTSVTGASVTFDNGTIGGDLSLVATAGDIDGNGTVSVAGGIALEASGGVGFGTLVAQNGDFTAVAGDDIIFTAIDSSQLVDLQAGGLILGDRIDAVTAITLAADGSITVDHAETGADFTAIAGGNFTTGLNSIITGGDIVIAGDIVNLGNSTAGGLIDVTGTQIDFVNLIAGSTVTLLTDFNTPTGVTGSGNLNITGTNITAGAGASSLNALGSIDISGLTSILGSLTMDALGDIAFGTAIVEGGSFFAAAGGAIELDSAEASDDIDFLAGLELTASGDVTASNNVFLESTGAGDIAADTINAGSDVTITTDGAVNVTSLAAAQSGTGDVQVSGATGVTIDVLTGNTATLQATNGAVAVAGNAAMNDLVTASGESVLLRAADDLAVTADATDGDIDIAVGGDLITSGISANGNIVLTSGGSIGVNADTSAGSPMMALPPGTQGVQQVTTVNGGNITITAGTDIVISSDVSAAGDLTMIADNLIDIQAAASGAAVDTLSSDINIGTSGTLGRSDLTTNISIATEGDIQLGGVAGTSTGFELDNDEFSRIHSGGDLTITAIGLTTGEGNINVSDLDVAVGQGTGTPTDGNIANFGGLFLEADNDVNVTGALIMTGAIADNLLAIDALNLITIDAETATVRIEDANGGVTGLIGMTADTIIAASSANLADVQGLSFADAEALLGLAPGSARPDGYILGSDISLNVGSGVFIENSGEGADFDDRRGIVADTLTVSSTNPDVGIVINGVIDTFTGLDALGIVGVPSGFDPASTVNGCLIGNPASCSVTVTPPTGSGDPGPIDGPIRDLIDDQVEEESPVVDTVSSILLELREDPEQTEDPLLNEPVTGAGNEDLWFEEEEEECEEGGDCELEPAE